MIDKTTQQGDFVFSQRDRFEHHLFRAEKFCRGYAWDWLVAEARWKDATKPIDLKGTKVWLKRGQLTHSTRHIAKIWNWDKAAVSRFIARLKTEAMIETSTEAGQMVITICNYDRYQSVDAAPETVTDTQADTAARQHRDSTETNKNKDNKDSDDDSRADQKSKNLFEEVTAILGIDIARNQNWFIRADIITELEQTYGGDTVLDAAHQVAKSGTRIKSPAYLREVCATLSEARQPVPSGTGSPTSVPSDETLEQRLARLREAGYLDDDDDQQEACHG